jgi:DNA polymerase epsilon subunit 1
MSYLYLYHVSSGDRHIYAVFSTSRNDAQIIIQNKTKDSQGMPNVDRIYSDAVRRRLEDSQGEPWQTMIDYQDDIHFKTTMVTTRRKALLELGDVIKRMKAEEGKPVIVVMQSPNQALLSHDIPILKDLPILPLHPDETDKQLPPLGWQSFIAKRLVNHYLDLGSWVAHLLELSRYGDIPLCNLESNDPRFLIDVAYARRLQKERVILWWSGMAKPDHAGHEKDDILGPLETVEMPSINNAGTYSSVCIDLNLRNLAINTILSSSLVNELEGADSVSFNPSAPCYDSTNDGTNIIYSDNAFASAGIMVLREMVKAWWIEAVQAGSGFSMADVMVQHLVRWVSSPGSFLYDRSLHYYVEMMSKKTLQQLMTDFKRVGSHIVFASPNRLLLQTTKAEVGNAYAYSQYIIKTIKSKPLFQFMELEIKEYWDYLVWYDEYNYGGKGCKEVVEEENQVVENIMCWQLAQFLPPTLQPTFNDWVIEFIELMHARKRPTVTDGSTPRVTQIPLRPLTVDPNEQTQILPKTFTKPLFKQISTLLRRQHTEMLHPELASDYEFPQLPGSHLKLQNSVLQLVKSIMQVLSLDRAISLEARLLRKEMLNLFDIREFSSEATFANPSAALTVRGVICDECTSSRDLDLCRDASLLPPVIHNNSETAPPPPKWKCDNCDSTYDKLRIEEQLVSDVQKVVLEWCTQDLKCTKCKSLRSNEFMEHCACAGEWVGTKNREDVRKKMKTYNNVAGFYGLRMLEAVVQECLEAI